MKNSNFSIKRVILTLAIIVGLFLIVVLIISKIQRIPKNEMPIFKNNEILSSISTNDLNKIIENKLPEWNNYWKEKIPGFSFSMFTKQNENPIAAEEYAYDSKANKLRESIYIYSPDKTKIIDPKGGMELFEKDGKILEAWDVDSSVKLIDLETNTWKQVASCGTPCGFNGAAWVDNNTFIVVGNYRGLTKEECIKYEECESSTLYVYDLLKNKVISYYGPKIERNFSEMSSGSNGNTSKTYTYKNHGFTIELPKGYIPHEEQAEEGPAIMITLPNSSSINYMTDAAFWNDFISRRYKYIKDEKIGETTFKVYLDGNVTIYHFKQGNVAYEYFGDKNLLKTFKFVGWSQ